MRLELLRHPHVVFHDGRQVMRVLHDPDLSSHGETQLNNFIGRLPIGGKAPWHHIYSSFLKRSHRAASEIAWATRTPHTAMDWLEELRWDPDWEGADYLQIKKEIDRWQQHDHFLTGYLEGPGGDTETFEAHRARIRPGLERLIEQWEDTDAKILVVSHHLTISEIISILLGIKGHQHPFDLGFMKSVTMYRTRFGLWRVQI